MSFKQKLFIDKDALKQELEKLLDIQITDLDLNYQSSGSTGAVNKISITTDHGKEDLLLKKVENNDYYSLYSDILTKFELSHPQIYGEIKIAGDTFLLMQWVEGVKGEWQRDDYFKAINWLVKKDKALSSHIEQIKNIPYIKQKNDYLETLKKERHEVFANGVKSYPEIFKSIKEDLLLDKSDQIFTLLSEEPLTLCHNDYCKNNILINNNAVYIIDWTGPNIATVGIDLAEILNNSPEEYQQQMLNLYIESTGFSDLRNVVANIQLNSLIGHINWRIKRLLRGDDTYEDIEEELQDVMQKISQKL